LKAECLGVFRIIVLRKIFEHTKKEVRERWRKLHKEFRTPYPSQNVFFASSNEATCGAHAAALNVGRPYGRDGFYDLYVRAEGNR
jgi:hypothetical protein